MNVVQFVKTFNVVRSNTTLYLLSLISQSKLKLPFDIEQQSNGSTLLLLWTKAGTFLS